MLLPSVELQEAFFGFVDTNQDNAASGRKGAIWIEHHLYLVIGMQSHNSTAGLATDVALCDSFPGQRIRNPDSDQEHQPA